MCRSPTGFHFLLGDAILTTGADEGPNRQANRDADSVISADDIIGRPIEVGPVTVVPVASCWFASLGAGQDGPGLFTGAVVSIRPSALVVINHGDVAVFSLRPSGVLERLKEVADDLGDMIGGRGEGHPAGAATNSDQVAGRVSGDPEAPSKPT